MGKLTITTQVPGAAEAVYKSVTAFAGPMSVEEPDARKKYGRLLQKVDNVYIFQEDREGGLQWRVSFTPPTQRRMEAVDPKWADRVDEFRQASGATQWTITWHTKARGIVALLQSFMFQTSGKRKVMRDIVEPVLAEFSSGPGKS